MDAIIKYSFLYLSFVKDNHGEIGMEMVANTRRQVNCTIIIFKEIHPTLSFVFLLWFCNVYYDFQLQMAFMSSLERITDVAAKAM
jgi:hypothetical protein